MINEAQIAVGIMYESSIAFELIQTYCYANQEVTGCQQVRLINKKIVWRGSEYDELLFTPVNEGLFELKDVTIGINFHWERKENQRFKGGLKFIVENGKLTAINLVSVEDYLVSVISSEMSATASLELLKAHAVISRSWLLAQQLGDQKTVTPQLHASSAQKTDAEEHIVWYERDAHTNFDVCADDHCQRYQGVTRANTDVVMQAVKATSGEVLKYEDTICDARFSKCCGGVLEEFQNCWDDVKYDYLIKKRDSVSDTYLPELTQEPLAESWIRDLPDAFCNTTDRKILAQVLNNYDQETANFFRWKVEYSQKELSELIKKRSGIDYGEILDLIPIARGASSRLVKLKIVGTKKSRVIGKELEIRRTLSESHLYSSAFVVDKLYESNESVPSKIILIGAGWGHGVGLCQIGAAVMGEMSYKYNEILNHYYPDTILDKLY